MVGEPIAEFSTITKRNCHQGKSSDKVTLSDTKGLKAFSEEHPDAKLIMLSLEERPRIPNGIEVWPWVQFLERLWERKVI